MLVCDFDFTGRIVVSPGVMWYLRKGTVGRRRSLVRCLASALCSKCCMGCFAVEDCDLVFDRFRGGVIVRFCRENNYPNFHNRKNCCFWILDMVAGVADVPAFEVQRGTGLAQCLDGEFRSILGGTEV